MLDSSNDWESYEREFQYYVALFRDKDEMADAFKAFGAAKTAMDGIKILTQYVDEIKDVQKRGELMRVIGELSVELGETKIRLAEQLQQNTGLQQEITILKEENKKLKSPDSKPIVKDGVYFVEEDGPFCTRCYDVEILLVRVVAVTAGTGMRRVGGNYLCPNCKASF